MRVSTAPPSAWSSSFASFAAGFLGTLVALWLVALPSSLPPSPTLPAPQAASVASHAATPTAVAPLAGADAHSAAVDGWAWVAVRRGVDDVAEARKRWTSQVGQDRMVAALHTPRGGAAPKRGGFFVDLASNDAVELSNTLTLEAEYGWRGLCVEANPRYTQGYAGRTCTLVQAVVGPRDGERVEFAMRNDNSPFGGVAGAGFDNKAGAAGAVVPRTTVALATLLTDLRAPREIDYLSLDIEGAEAWALSTFPFDALTFRVLTVERPKRELRAALAAHNYTHVCDNGSFGDQLWIHESFADATRHALPGLVQGPNGVCCEPKDARINADHSCAAGNVWKG